MADTQSTQTAYTYPHTQEEAGRVSSYSRNELLYLGDHYTALNIKQDDFGRTEDFGKTRYIVANFPGIVTRLCADMLFEEFPKIRLPDGDDKFIDALFQANNLRTQIYESALEQSFRGDVVFRIRTKDNKIIIEDINPSCFYPKYPFDNVRAEPEYMALEWKVKFDDLGECLYVERHYKGRIETNLYQIKDKELIKVDLKSKYPNTEEVVNTGVNEFMVVHIPNHRINTMWNGLSDYHDLVDIFKAINNRISRNNVILNKHSDPILAVPQGVIDDTGSVNRSAFGMIEVRGSGSGQQKDIMPQYIVWDANLEAAFKEIDILMEVLFMTAEMTPSAFGMDKNGQAESGRALKFKLLRTIAKKHRKQLYYDHGLRQLLYVAQLLAKKGYTAGDYKMQGNPVVPTIEWSDGIINDYVESIDAEDQALTAGITTRKDAIARVYSMTDKEAKDKADEIDSEKKSRIPQFSVDPKVIPPDASKA